MRALAAGLLLLAGLAGPLLAPGPARAAGEGPTLELTYLVNLEDPGLRQQGIAQLTWRATGLQGHVSAVCLHTDDHEYDIDPTSFGPQPPWEYHPRDVDKAQGRPECERGYRALVGDGDSVQATMRVDLRRAAFSPCRCEYNSYLANAWGVVKGEAFALPFSYSYFNPQPAFHAVVRFQLPPGWSVEAPWTRLSPEAFELPPGGPPLPRGFAALGQFTAELDTNARDSVGKTFVYVRLAQELRDRAGLFDYLEKATPYYESVYGNVTGSKILVVSAGAPMFTGGLGATDSLFVHQNASRETTAHEYAHVWQSFQTIGQAGESSIWLNEGDADLHGALSRFVTETQPGYTLEALRDEFRDAYDKYSRDPDQRQPLAAAAYGEEFEQVAYKKGLFTLLFLDHEVRNLTGQRYGLRDVLAEMNRVWNEDISQQTGERRASNEDVLRVVDSVVQRSSNVEMRPFFDAFVWGTRWPPYVDAPAEVPVVFSGLSVEPRAVEPGGTVTVRVLATNVAQQPETRAVELLLDDNVTASRTVTVPSLQATPVIFTVPAGPPGAHKARVAYLEGSYRVLTPANLSVESVLPEGQPQAGVAFDLVVRLRNSGESAARASVEAVLGSDERVAEVVVPPTTVGHALLTFLVPQESTQPVEVLVRWGHESVTSSAQVRVGPRDRDGDGVPDAQDAYPDNPKLAEKSVVSDLRSSMPGPGLVALAAGLGLAAYLRRRCAR
jgi:hypothetical protein